MRLEKILSIDEYGFSSMMCTTISNKIIVYGGSNFKNICPPEGKKILYNDIRLYDKDFNLLSEKKGKIFPEKGIIITNDTKSYYISGVNNTKIYEYTIIDNEVIEKELYDLHFEILGGYGFIYNNCLYFGLEKMYELNLNTLELKEKAEFIGDKREQSVYIFDGRYMYLFGGASNICHLDAFKYDVLENVWIKIKDIEISLTGSSWCKLDEKNYIIMGGFNKEVYDEAVKNLSDINYKREYFKRDRKEFKWNKKILKFNTKTEEFKIIGEDDNSSTCGSTLVNVCNKIFLINGEIKPGIRTGNVYQLVEMENK